MSEEPRVDNPAWLLVAFVASLPIMGLAFLGLMAAYAWGLGVILGSEMMGPSLVLLRIFGVTRDLMLIGLGVWATFAWLFVLIVVTERLGDGPTRI